MGQKKPITIELLAKEAIIPSVLMIKLSVLKGIFRWIFTGCRVFAGILVVKTGIGLMEGGSFSGYNRQGDLFTGGFILIIGLYFIFSSLFPAFFKDDR